MRLGKLTITGEFEEGKVRERNRKLYKITSKSISRFDFPFLLAVYT